MTNSTNGVGLISRRWSDIDRPLSPSELIIDSQSVKTATMVHEHVGYDGAKKVKGRKRHLAVDTLGLSVRVLVTDEDNDCEYSLSARRF